VNFFSTDFVFFSRFWYIPLNNKDVPWAPLGHHWCPSPFFNPENESKVLPKCHWSWKVLQKVTQKNPKSSKILEKQRFLHLAWRTARSAYNPPAPFACKGELGACWDQRLNSFLSLTPLKVSPVAPRSPLYPSSSPPLWSPFFQSLTDLTNLARLFTFCAPQAPKMTPKSEKKRSANLFEKHLQNKTHF